MRLADFETMVEGMAAEIPDEFLEGLAEIAVSPRVIRHPERIGVYTLGECIPLPTPGADPDSVQSRVMLYHGSFAALAREQSDFDWREEAWETLAHEVRHHVEWRARAPDLEAFDEAAEQNYARHDGQPFDPLFYRDGERMGPASYRIEDDYFVEVPSRAVRGGVATFEWGGRSYRVQLPRGLKPPALLTVAGVDRPPPGDLVLVIHAVRGWSSLLGRVVVTQLEIVAEAV